MIYDRTTDDALCGGKVPKEAETSPEDQALSYLATVLVEAYLEQRQHETTNPTN
jgi:hypothetical protein